MLRSLGRECLAIKCHNLDIEHHAKVLPDHLSAVPVKHELNETCLDGIFNDIVKILRATNFFSMRSLRCTE